MPLVSRDLLECLHAIQFEQPTRNNLDESITSVTIFVTRELGKEKRRKISRNALRR